MSRETPISRAEYSAMEPRDQGMYDEDDPDAHHDYEDEEPEAYSGPYTVCLFSVALAYGGPEEGGWYYQAGYPILTTDLRVFTNVDDAIEYRASLDDLEESMNEGRPPLSDVNSDGRYSFRICEGWPKPFPQERPFYS